MEVAEYFVREVVMQTVIMKRLDCQRILCCYFCEGNQIGNSIILVGWKENLAEMLLYIRRGMETGLCSRLFLLRCT